MTNCKLDCFFRHEGLLHRPHDKERGRAHRPLPRASVRKRAQVQWVDVAIDGADCLH